MGYTRHNWFNDGSSDAIPISAQNLNEMEDGIAGAICRDGDSMSGQLKLHSTTPTDNLEAVSKWYTDNNMLFIKVSNDNVPTNGLLVGTIQDFEPDKYLLLIYTEASAAYGSIGSFVIQNYDEIVNLSVSNDPDKIQIKKTGEIYLYYTKVLGDKEVGSVSANILLLPCQYISFVS